MKSLKRYSKRLIPVAMAFGLVAGLGAPASAATYTTLSVAPADTTPSATNITYSIGMSSVSSGTSVKCIAVKFSTTADGTGAVPTGMSASSATLNAGSTIVAAPASFTPGNTANTAKFTYTTGSAAASASGRTLILGGITNPSVTTPFYVLVNTYGNTDCATTPVDNGTAMTTMTPNTTVSAVVDPTLTFGVTAGPGTCNTLATSGDATSSGTAVGLGRVNASVLKYGTQTLTTSTNANNGYTVYVSYTGAMNDGAGHTVADWTGTNATPTASWAAGTENLGYTSGDSTLAGTANRFTNGGPKFAGLTTSSAEVAYNGAPIANDANCVGYQLGVSGSTRAGNYSTTVEYTAVPVY